ncbi:ABC transporter substrate-binding protein [Thalassospira marina]|uniref:ABC transporter substrate-binding protein n=1 Tax=Thalassospira marina TaxID=2048283 RepID=A0A2N3KZD5_9PROT|nr:ABC transporter substrate-binding protein [Thalassospira marina]PKR55903.1 ABC transporter substrate-binding protein [Thalassospira marina]
MSKTVTLARLLAASLLGGAVALAALPASADPAPDMKNWDAVVKQAQGQTVYWYAWGGEPRINDYIAWAGKQVQERYGVTVKQVKLADTADAVSKVVSEKAAGKNDGGAVDMIWINGENFAAMKRNDLLFGPWVEQTPNFKYVDVTGKPTTVNDFTVPTDGLEAPWGMAQLSFFDDTSRVETAPRSAQELLAWLQNHPGRFTYPQPPDYMGSSFLKQVLTELVADPAVLQKPTSEADAQKVLAPLWTYLAKLQPVLWREGKAYPANGAALRAMMADNEIDIGFSFSAAEVSAAIANFELPDTVRSFVFDGGTLGNTNFVAIPFNASAKAGAVVLADFLMSPQAQLRKQNPEIWGSFTVLDMNKIPEADRKAFDALDLGVATLSPAEMGNVLPEPHPSWMELVESEWQKRYGVAK